MSTETDCKWEEKGYSPLAEWAILRYAVGEQSFETLSSHDAFWEMLSYGWCRCEVLTDGRCRCEGEPDEILVGKWLQYHGLRCTLLKQEDEAPQKVNKNRMRDILRLQDNYLILRREDCVPGPCLIPQEQTSVALWRGENGEVCYYDVIEHRVRCFRWDDLDLSSFTKVWRICRGASTEEALQPPPLENALASKIADIKNLYQCLKDLTSLCSGNVKAIEEEEMFFSHYIGGTGGIDKLHVAVCGEAKRGKSAFINALLGIPELLEEHYRNRTSVIVRITPSGKTNTHERAYRVVDSAWKEHRVDEAQAKKMIAADEPEIVAAQAICSSPLLTHLKMELLDTPGSDSLYREIIRYQVDNAPRWDAVLYVVDSGESPLNDADVRKIRTWESEGIAVGVIQTAKDIISEDKNIEIAFHNKERLQDNNFKIALKYHKVDSSLRFQAKTALPTPSLADLVHSGYPELLYELNTQLAPQRSLWKMIRDAQTARLDKHRNDLQRRIKIKVKNITRVPDDDRKTLAKLRRNLNDEKEKWVKALKRQFQDKDLVNAKLEELSQTTDERKMTEIACWFNLTQYKEAFRRYVIARIKTDQPGEETTASDDGENPSFAWKIVPPFLQLYSGLGAIILSELSWPQMSHGVVALTATSISAYFAVLEYKSQKRAFADRRKTCFNKWEAFIKELRQEDSTMMADFQTELENIINEQIGIFESTSIKDSEKRTEIKNRMNRILDKYHIRLEAC